MSYIFNKHTICFDNIFNIDNLSISYGINIRKTIPETRPRASRMFTFFYNVECHLGIILVLSHQLHEYYHTPVLELIVKCFIDQTFHVVPKKLLQRCEIPIYWLLSVKDKVKYISQMYLHLLLSVNNY